MAPPGAFAGGHLNGNCLSLAHPSNLSCFSSIRLSFTIFPDKFSIEEPSITSRNDKGRETSGEEGKNGQTPNGIPKNLDVSCSSLRRPSDDVIDVVGVEEPCTSMAMHTEGLNNFHLSWYSDFLVNIFYNFHII